MDSSNEWRIQSIEKNNTWELTTLSLGKKSIGVKWVYKTKYKLDGNVDWFKARLVENAINRS